MSVTKYTKTAGGTYVKTSIEIKPCTSPIHTDEEEDQEENPDIHSVTETFNQQSDAEPGVNPLMCAHCRKNFFDSNRLKSHYLKFHKEFMDFNFTEHKRKIRKLNRHLCKKCDKHFGDSWTLKHHLQTVHMAIRKHPCLECNKAFLSNKDMLRHLRGVHKGEKVLFPGRQRERKEKELTRKENKNIITESYLDKSELSIKVDNPSVYAPTETVLVIEESLSETPKLSRTVLVEAEVIKSSDPLEEAELKNLENHRDLSQKNNLSEHVTKSRIGSELEPTFKQGNTVLGKEVQIESSDSQVEVNLNINEHIGEGDEIYEEMDHEEEILVDNTMTFVNVNKDNDTSENVELESEEIIIEVIDSVENEQVEENNLQEEVDEPQVIEIQTEEGDIHQFRAFLQSDKLEEMTVLMPDDLNKQETEQAFASAFLEQNGEIRIKRNADVEESPIFELENLENLQFVVTEGSTEPQIVIPENGIMLNIPLSGGKENLLDMMDKLSELPDKFAEIPGKFTELPELQSEDKYEDLSDFSENHSSKLHKMSKFTELSDISVPDQLPELPITMNSYNSNIDHIDHLPDFTEHDLETVGMKIGNDLNISSETPFPDSLPLVEILNAPVNAIMDQRRDELLDQLEGKQISVKELDASEEPASGTPKFISRLEFNSAENSKKYIYKKAKEDSKVHLVAVKEPKNLEVINLTNRSPLKHFKIDRTYKCDKCDRFFISKSFLDKHIVQVHPAFIDIQISNDISADAGQPKNDIDLDEIENIAIDVVGYSDNDENDVIKPMMNPVSQTVMISSAKDAPRTKRKLTIEKSQCQKCSWEFFGRTAKSKLRAHTRSAHSTEFSCYECSDTFTSRSGLKSHVAAVHELIKKVCPECHKAVNDLTRHIRLQHKKKDNREYPCDYCEQAFRTDYSLKRHLEVIHFKLKKWSCDLCEKLFGEKRDMLRHKTAVHFGIKNQAKVWKCPECNVNFKLRREYNQHKASHHPNLTNDQVIKFLNSELETKTSYNAPKLHSNLLKY